MKYRVDRGIALLMVMLVVVLVSILTGAFLTLNKTNLFLLGSAKDKALAYEGCQSALEYAQAQLSNDFTWGTTAFASKTEVLPSSVSPIMELRYSSSGGKVSTNKISGVLHFEKDCQYDLRVYNNLNVKTVWTVNGVDIPPQCVRLEAQATVAQSRKRVVILLRESPLLDASAFSQSDMDISLDKSPEFYGQAYWKVSSFDPLHNLVRSNANIRGPYTSGADANPKIQYSIVGGGPKGATKPPYGSARAAGDVILYDQASRAHSLSNLAVRSSQETRAKGSFDTNSLKYNVPDLSPQALKVAATSIKVSGGLYYFDKAGSTVTLKYFPEPTSDPTTATPAKSWKWDGIGAGSQIADVNGLRADLSSLQLVVPGNKQAEIEPDRGFKIGGNVPPVLVFEKGANNGALTTSGKSGFIDIQGTVAGQGALISKDSSLSIRVGSNVDASKLKPLALYAGGNINLSQTQYDPTRLTAADYDFYSIPASTKVVQGTNWAGLSDAQRLSKASSIASVQLASKDFNSMLSNLFAEFSDLPDAARTRIQTATTAIYEGVPNPAYDPNYAPPPPLPGDPPPPPGEPQFLVPPREATVGDYVRMKQFLASVRQDSASPKDGDLTWLDSGHSNEIPQLISGNFSQIQQMVGYDMVWDKNLGWVPKWRPVSNYLAQPTNPLRAGEEPPMVFHGLVYSHDGDFNFQADKRRLQIEGSIVARHAGLHITGARSVDFVYNPAYSEDMFDKSKLTFRRLEQVFFAAN